MTEIEPLHRYAYRSGTDPIEYAVTVACMQIEAANEIRAARARRPDAYPVFKGSLSDDATARRVVAELMNAGWTPPSEDAIRRLITDEETA